MATESINEFMKISRNNLDTYYELDGGGIMYDGFFYLNKKTFDKALKKLDMYKNTPKPFKCETLLPVDSDGNTTYKGTKYNSQAELNAAIKLEYRLSAIKDSKKDKVMAYVLDDDTLAFKGVIYANEKELLAALKEDKENKSGGILVYRWPALAELNATSNK
jgi:hypothetical protein